MTEDANKPWMTQYAEAAIRDAGMQGIANPGANPGTVISIGRSEREIAVDIRERVRGKLSEVGLLLDEANRAGMRINFQMGVDGFGRNIVAMIDVTKPVA